MKYDMLRIKPLALKVPTKDLKRFLSETVAIHIGSLQVSGAPNKEIKAWEVYEGYLKKYTADRNYYELLMSTMKVEHPIFKYDDFSNPNKAKVTNFDGLFNVLKPLSSSAMKKKSSVSLNPVDKKSKYDSQMAKL